MDAARVRGVVSPDRRLAHEFARHLARRDRPLQPEARPRRIRAAEPNPSIEPSPHPGLVHEHRRAAAGPESGGRPPTGVGHRPQLLGRVGSKLHWIYDYGDGWYHRITTETRIEQPDKQVHCIAGRNAAPPEDCGGPPGYTQLLAALADPNHPDHDSLREWLGTPLDPAAFDQGEVDLALAAVHIRGVTPPR